MSQVLAYNATTTSATSQYSTLRRDTDTVGGMMVEHAQYLTPVPEFEHVALEVPRLLGDRLSLTMPLPVLFSRGPIDTSVTSRILDVYGIGANPREAFEDWCAEVEHEYYFLAENVERLGPPLQRRWESFQRYLQPTLFG